MTTHFKLLLVALTLSFLGACASTPDPAEVCTSEWIAPRADNAVERIEKRAKSSLKTFSSVAKTRAEGKNPDILQRAKLYLAVESMKKELTRGQGIKDLKTLAQTCNDPKLVGDSMRGLLERNGLRQNIITWLEGNPIYQRLISTVSAPEPVKPNG